MTESKYYILYNDNTTSTPHSLYELSCTEEITKHTLIIKDSEEPKPAGAFIDFTDNRQTPLPKELNTFNAGAFLLIPFWAYNNIPKYKIYWSVYILFTLLFDFFSMYTRKNQSNEIDKILSAFLIVFFIPAILTSIFFLIKGNEMAWKSRKFKNIQQFKDIQKKWSIWGYWLWGLIILCLIICDV